MARVLENDLTEAVNWLETLRQHLRNSSARGEVRQLEKQVESFDTDGPLKRVEAIAWGLGMVR